MILSTSTPTRRRLNLAVAVLVLTACLFSSSGLTSSASVAVTTGHIGAARSNIIEKFVSDSLTPTPDSVCLSRRGAHCYSPQQIRQAYGLNGIYAAGYTGAGQSIVIIDAFGSPTIEQDLKTFDQAYGLPDPPSLRVIAPLGSVPVDPTNPDQAGWAGETTLDVEWAHAIAPGANIVLLTSPVSETEGVQGLPEFLALEKYALDNHLGNIISQSWSATENTLFEDKSGIGGYEVLRQFEAFYQRARQEHVSVFASSGDEGAAGFTLDGNNFYPFPAVGYPASSPLVSAVGGTSLEADAAGNYKSETVWNDGYGAGGGGISQYFALPDYQENNLSASVKAQLKGKRGIPDISYNGGVLTGLGLYQTFPSTTTRFYLGVGGTSAGAPQWAGIAALANQEAGYPLGFLNPSLYRLGNSNQASEVYHDITQGDITFEGIPGYPATAGWDLATGWGSPRTDQLAKALTRLVTPVDFNLLVLGNLSLTGGGSDVAGRVGVGGNANITSASFNQDLIVNGNLNFGGGTINGGNAVYGTSASLNGVNISRGQAIKTANPFSVSTARAYVEGISNKWAGLSANGTTTVQYGGVILQGSDAKQNVFRVKGSDLSSANYVQISVPTGATAIINVDGTSDRMGNLGISLNGTDKQHVVFNFWQATSLTVSGVNVTGSLWAPKAAVNFSNGQLMGNLVANSLSGGGRFEFYPFLGGLPL